MADDISIDVTDAAFLQAIVASLLSLYHEGKPQAAGIYFDNEALSFTLKALHDAYDGEQLLSFKQFAEKLFQNPINATLADHGLILDIEANYGKIVKNRYRLRRR